MRYFRLPGAVIALSLTLSVNAQTKQDENYRKQSAEIRKNVWAWDMAQFRNREVPAEFATASRVVLARHTEFSAESKSKVAFYGLSFGVNKQQTITEVSRELLKLNDKSAVSDYSELSFTQFSKKSSFYSKDKMTTYVGVRVIKPNGTVKELEADDIVLTKNNESEKKAKLAVPDLQPGDMIDYFIATEQVVTNDFSENEYNVLLFDDAPVVSLSYHGQLGKKFAIVYRSYNGAPELKVAKGEGDDILIDIAKKNIPAYENSLWVNAAQQLPHVRMLVSLGYSGMGSRYLSARKPGLVEKNINPDDVIDDKSENFSQQYYDGYWMKIAKKQYDDIESDAKKYAKQMGTPFKEMSDDEKAAMLYYTLRFTKIINFDINNLSRTLSVGSYRFDGLPFVLFATMKAAGLDPAILVGPRRFGYRMNEIMRPSDLETTAYLTGSNKIFSIVSAFDHPFYIPAEIEGTTDNKSFTFDHPGAVMSVKKMRGLTNIAEGPKIPYTPATANTHIENLSLSLANDKLLVKRQATIRGHYKSDYQRDLIVYEDYYEAERKAFHEEKSLIEDLEDSKKGRKVVDEVKQAFADARKKQKDAFLQNAKDWFEQEITDLADAKVDNLGVRHNAPDFVFSSSFKMGGLVKKAGNNYIIEIGKIQGSPLSVKPEQRKRTTDIFMPFARGIEYHIDFTIPDGYTAEGVSELNKKVENETGFFIVEASQTDKQVTIKIRKQYLNAFEPVTRWEKLLQFIDASNDWLNTKILLRKK